MHKYPQICHGGWKSKVAWVLKGVPQCTGRFRLYVGAGVHLAHNVDDNRLVVGPRVDQVLQ